MASTSGWLKEQVAGLRSFAGSPGANIQLAQAEGELLPPDPAQMTPAQKAFMDKYGPKPGKPAAPAAPVRAPAPAAPDPLNLKRTLEKRQQGASLADSPVMVAQTDKAMDTPEGRYIRSATQNPNAVGAPSVLPPAPVRQPPLGPGPNHPWITGVPVPGAPSVLPPAPVRQPPLGPGPNHPWSTGVPVPGSPPAPRSELPEDIQLAARGGSFDEGDEVLVGEEGPELVSFGGPGEVAPLAAAAAGATRRKGASEVKKTLRQGAKIGRDALGRTREVMGKAYEGVKGFAGKVFKSPGSVGSAAGQAVNAAEQGVAAVRAGAAEAVEGYNTARGGPGTAKPHITAAQAALTERNAAERVARMQQGISNAEMPGRFKTGAEEAAARRAAGAAPRTPASVMPNLVTSPEAAAGGGVGAPPEAPKGGRFARGLRSIGGALVSPLSIGLTTAAVAGPEAYQMTGEVMRGEMEATPENRPARAARIMTGGLWQPAGSTPVRPPQIGAPNTQSGSVPPAQAPVRPAGTFRQVDPNSFGGVVPRGGMTITNDQTGATTAYQASPERIAEEEQRVANDARASREARESLAGYQPVGGEGMRGGKVNPGIRAMGRIAAFGGASRLAQNQAAIDVAREGASSRNALARASLQLQASNTLAARRKENEGRNMSAIEGIARGRVESPGLVGSATGAHEADVKREAGQLTNIFRHTAGNMKDAEGNRLELADLSEGQVQQLSLRYDMREKLRTARGTWTKAFGDYFGTKRYESRDLNDFEPSHYSDSSQKDKGLGIIRWIVLKSGEKIPVTAGVGGAFNIFGPNDPMDKQLFEMAEAADSRYKARGGK